VPIASSHRHLLLLERDRAERLLHAVRLVVLAALAGAALAYSPTLPQALNRVNVVLLVVMFTWTVGQHRLFFHRPTLPGWLSLANPVVDISAVTTLLAAYGFAYSPALALDTPIVAAYFVIMAALPVASTASKAAAVSGLAIGEYLLLMLIFLASGRLETVLSPVAAAASGAVSPLDEGAKVLLLASAGAVATYAARWQERLSLRIAEAAVEQEALVDRLEQARLQALRLQLQPHFLFNALNTITALVHRDPRSAERMVTGLSELLRASLGPGGDQEVRLDRELELVRHYLDIQQVRFADRLMVALAVDADTHEAMVPSLMLQPLVENAILHGIASRAAGGTVAIAAKRRNGMLLIDVTDDGIGASESYGEAREGVGLGNTRARLRSLYGERHRFEAGPRPGGGYHVVIEIPYHTVARRAGEEGTA
jgi:two-component sensor histidine kinase